MTKGPKSRLPESGIVQSQFFIDAESGKACNLHVALETFDQRHQGPELRSGGSQGLLVSDS